MKTFLKIIFLFILSTALSSCGAFCTEGEGSIQTETRGVEDFKNIALDLSADVTVVKGQPTKVEIETYGNLFEKIKTKTGSGKLKLSSSGCFLLRKKLKSK